MSNLKKHAMSHEENELLKRQLKEDLDHYIEIIHLIKDRRIKEKFKRYAEETLEELANL